MTKYAPSARSWHASYPTSGLMVVASCVEAPAITGTFGLDSLTNTTPE